MKKILEKVVRYLIRKMVTVILLITMRNVTGTEVIVVVPPDITVILANFVHSVRAHRIFSN